MHLTENKLSPAHSSVSFLNEKNYCWLWALYRTHYCTVSAKCRTCERYSKWYI